MTNFRRLCLAIALLSPAILCAASTNLPEMVWTRIIWLPIAPYFLAAPVLALCQIVVVLLGVFEDSKLRKLSVILLSVFTLLSSILFFGTVVFGDSGATV